MSTDPASAPDGLRDPFPSPSPARARFPRRTALPDYLPARMVNEFVYCPRLFFYEWVEGVFAHSSDTIEGALRHEKLETKHDAMPAPEASGETIHARSVQLSSETHRLIAVIDLVEGDGQRVTPVDYKRGAPRDGADGPEAWDADRAQVCAQALILRDNGYHCDEAVLYYNKTKQRVRVAIDEALVAETLAAITGCRSTAEAHRIPPPLVDSPKCPRCSLVSICLPDETAAAMWLRDSHDDGEQLALFGDERTGGVNAPDLTNADAREPRRLMPARDDLRPLYVTGYGISIGKSGEVLQVREKKVLIKEVRLNEVSQVNVFGNISVTAPAVQGLCSAEKPIAYFSTGGWFYGLTQGLGLRNVFLRRDQFRRADDRAFCVRVAREIVATKIRNQRTLLQRNHVEPPARIQQILKQLSLAALRTEDLDVLLGIEGAAARTYFEQLSGMLKPDDDEAAPAFDFTHRNRRPPRDPVNALLSMAYSLLVRDLTTVCHSIGFDPFIGFYHQPRFGRPALALDLMEGFRPIIADSAVLTVINTGMVTASDFVRVGPAVSLAASGRKALIRAYEQRMDNLVTHPLFGYRVSYRRVLEIQARLLARVVTGELHKYPGFETR